MTNISLYKFWIWIFSLITSNETYVKPAWQANSKLCNNRDKNKTKQNKINAINDVLMMADQIELTVRLFIHASDCFYSNVLQH